MEDVSILDQKTLTAIINELQYDPAYIGNNFLPFVTVPTDVTVWDILVNTGGIANFRAKDGEAELMQEEANKQAMAEVADIAEKTRFNATDLRKLREAGQAPLGIPSLLGDIGAEAERKVARRMAKLRQRVDARVEWMQIQALTGSISFSGKVVFDVDYGIPAGQSSVTPTTDWDTVATATPLDDIMSWMDTVENACGVRPRNMIVSNTVLRYLSQNTALRDTFKYTKPFFNIGDVKGIMSDNAELNIIPYNALYTAANGTRTRMLDENMIILLPDKTLPNGDPFADTATTPHPLNNYQSGFYTWRDEKKDPYGLEVGTGITAFPRLYHPETILTAVVAS
jgi:hypothetical protein